MMADEKYGALPIAIGFRALRGGAAAVGVFIEAGEPRVLLSCHLATSIEGDRLSLEPYHVAAEMERGPDGGPSVEAATVVAEGRRRQNELAKKNLKDILCKVWEMGGEPVVAALLVNRASWVNDLLSYSLAYPDHRPVAEGLAVRGALRYALGEAGVETKEFDEKSLPNLASEAFEIGSKELEAYLKALGKSAGKPWRKEQKLACLAAWVALSGSL